MDHRLLSGETSLDYSAIKIPGGNCPVQRKYSAMVLAVAGVLAVMGVTAEIGLNLHSSVQTTRPGILPSVALQPQRTFTKATIQRNGAFEGSTEEHISLSTRNTSEQPFSLLKGGIASIVGMLLGIAGICVHRQVSRPWVMAAEAMEMEADDLPTADQIAAVRQQFLRLQGKTAAGGADELFGEVPKPVVLTGDNGPIDLMEMYAQFEQMLGSETTAPTVGTRVTGTVFDIDEKGASVDFGRKTIGYCPLEELALCKVKRAEDVLDVGQQRQFVIVAPTMSRRKNEEEMTLLSMKAIQEEIAWKRLQQYREHDITFHVVIKGKNRGGYMVEVDDLTIPGFLPKSQATSDLATAPDNADPATFMDQVVAVKVLDLDQERKRLVVSQRAASPKMITDTFKIGTVHEGIVQNVRPYGIFVDVNGVNGLLHISQISHNRIDNVESIFKVGEKIKCMVLSQDQVQGRLALSTKRLEPTHGDMLTNPQLVYEKAEEMAERFREDIAAAERRMQEFEAKLAEQTTVAFQ